MDTSQLAKALGRLGGRSRARNLSAERKKEIARMGGQARALSHHAERRLTANFEYVKAMTAMRPRPRVKRLKRSSEKLPGLYV